MKHFAKLWDGEDVDALNAEIAAHPELWNEHPERLGDGPFKGTSDIWLRYRPLQELTEPVKFIEPFINFVWYPAAQVLSTVRMIAEHLMLLVGAETLGGVMITRIPAGGRVGWHHDRGSWHAETFTTKLYVPLAANPLCVNRCEHESVVMNVGEVWTFNNLVDHCVENFGNTPRMTLIVCMRVDP